MGANGASASSSRWRFEAAVKDTDPPQVVGYKIFVRLLLLVLLLLGLLTFYAWVSYPKYEEILGLVDSANASALRVTSVPPTTSRNSGSPEVDYTVAAVNPAEAWEQARRAWLTNLKDLGQLFLLTPVFPLIGAVIGYIFGERRGREEASVEQAPQPAGPSGTGDS
jgi:hypothetical protein